MVARLFPFGWSVRSHRRSWKVTLRSAPLFDFVLLEQWHEEIRVLRWEWLAKAVAGRHRRRRGGLVTEAIVESYVPGHNVVPFDGSARSTAPAGR